MIVNVYTLSFLFLLRTKTEVLMYLYILQSIATFVKLHMVILITGKHFKVLFRKYGLQQISEVVDFIHANRGSERYSH